MIGFMACGDCGKSNLTEREAVLHECGVEPEEPELAEAPATTRDVVEAIQGLALQVALVREQMEKSAEMYGEMKKLVAYYVGRVEEGG